jgi:hypothetical protein
MGTDRDGLLAGYLTEDELAKELGHHIRTVARWRVLRTGPPYVMTGREIRYSVDAVRQWLAAGGTEAAKRNKPKRKG